MCINTNIRDLKTSRSKDKMYLRREEEQVIPKRGSSMNKETELDLIYHVSREVNESFREIWANRHFQKHFFERMNKYRNHEVKASY